MKRRELLAAATAAAITSTAFHSSFAADGAENRKFTMDLCPGRIGVKTSQEETLSLAAEFGFESVEPFGWHLAKLNADELADLTESLKAKQLVWGAAGLSVDFRSDDASFSKGLKKLPEEAAALQNAGVTRIGTWLRPSHDDLTYLANLRQHAKRLRQVARILDDHNLSLGLEYVGPRTSWTVKRYAFIHTMAETQELISEIGASNVGLVLDSWHWYTAEESIDAIKSLENQEVVAVDLNDAPAGIPVEKQIDNRRELPAATGVIDVKSFLNALVEIGYDGPIRAEPFNKPLNELDNKPAVQATATAIKKAFAQIS